jgi:hypothetical protein
MVSSPQRPKPPEMPLAESEQPGRAVSVGQHHVGASVIPMWSIKVLFPRSPLMDEVSRGRGSISAVRPGYCCSWRGGG